MRRGVSRVTTMNAIEIKQMRINYWLRYHIEYQVMIRLCTRYVCIEVQVTRREWDSQNHKFKEKYLKRWLGNSLEELLDELIAYLKIDEWEGEYKWWKPLSE
jgi:hypothetical protein